MQTVIQAQRDCHSTAQCFAQVTKGADDPKGSYEFLVQVSGESGRGYELAAAKEVDRSRWMSALEAAKSEWERPNVTQPAVQPQLEKIKDHSGEVRVGMVNDWNHLKAYWDQLQVKVQHAAQLSVPPPQNEIDTVVSRAALCRWFVVMLLHHALQLCWLKERPSRMQRICTPCRLLCLSIRLCRHSAIHSFLLLWCFSAQLLLSCCCDCCGVILLSCCYWVAEEQQLASETTC
jgi:hypothetical protein